MQERLQRAPSSSCSLAGGQHHAFSIHYAAEQQPSQHVAGRLSVLARRPQHPAFLHSCLAIVGDSGTEDRPLTTPAGVSRLAHPGPPSYLSSPALLSNASISKPPRPLSAVAHSAHAIAPALRVSVAIVRPPAHRLPPLLGVRTAASPAEAPGLPASPPRALATAPTHSLSHSVIWPI
jgi:hypothetical protein